MSKKQQQAARVVEAQHVVDCAVRWASNMIVEVVSNHGRWLSPEQRLALKDASAALAHFQIAKLPENFTPEES